jgi:hypothetical protein
MIKMEAAANGFPPETTEIVDSFRDDFQFISMSNLQIEQAIVSKASGRKNWKYLNNLLA